jgi:hypothetical protein
MATSLDGRDRDVGSLGANGDQELIQILNSECCMLCPMSYMFSHQRAATSRSGTEMPT